ncbi:MAG: hypothetical protein Q4E02_05265 [Lagierella massiliensis]|nr:hypothetical protein [Lagierella massiliensis]
MNTKKIMILCSVAVVLLLAFSCKKKDSSQSTRLENVEITESQNVSIKDNLEKIKVIELPIEITIDDIQDENLKQLSFISERDGLKKEINNIIEDLKNQYESTEVKHLLPIRIIYGKHPNDFEFSMEFEEDNAHIRLNGVIDGDWIRHFYSFKESEPMYNKLQSLYSNILEEVGLTFEDVYGVTYESEKSRELFDKATEYLKNK